MTADPSAPGYSPEQRQDDIEEELRSLRRRIAEAKAEGEDPLPIVRRAVLATIDAVASRLRPAPDDESEP